MTTKQIAWQMLVQACLLLLLYAAASLFLGAKFLATDPLAVALPFSHVAALKHILMDAALLTGLLGAAVYFLLDAPSALLTWVYRAWTVFLLVLGLTGLMGFYEGRHFLELPFVLDIALLVLLALWLLVLIQGKANPAKDVFLAALILLGLSYGLSLLPIQSPLYDRILRVVMVNARYFVAFPLAAIAVAYWLKNDIVLYNVAAAMAVLGSLVSIAPLTAVSAIPATGIIIAPLIFLLALFVTRMTISKDNWGNLSLLLMMLSLGVLGTAFAIPALGKHMLGTQLSEVQIDLAAWAVVALLFSLICGLSEDNHQSIRFWFIAAGVVGSAFALGIAGVVQVFMERVLSIGYLDTQSTIIALYMLWIVGMLLWGLGIFLQTFRLLRQAI